ncbi:hypothetical protein Bbelb_029370 [Branchiostoma belcheri]|nr:hypothetical protein Bbelb_029370 [Branchiostoma belcheri]
MAVAFVCFVKVDPSFQVVMDAINELSNYGLLRHDCTVTAGNNGLRSASNNQQFGSPKDKTGYGFARTLGSVLRAFMLRSTYLEALHDPNIRSKKSTVNINVRANPAGYNRNVQPQGVPMAQLPVTQNVVQAKKISADFDRLYPHFFIENKLAAVLLGTWVDLPGMMVIVELQGGVIVKIHTINATVRARHNGAMYGPMPQAHNGPNPHIFHCPDPTVVRATSTVHGLQPEQSAGNNAVYARPPLMFLEGPSYRSQRGKDR